MFQELEQINQRPKPFEFYTASELWTDEHTSKHMLAAHLDGEIDLASRKTAFIDRSVDWIVSHFGVSSQTKIADFGCGPGLYTSRLARAGAQVTGIDFSPRSIRYAREEAERTGLSIRYVNQNYLEFGTEARFHLILMIFCDFCALSPTQRRQMLTRFHRFLKPGGHVLLDACSLAAFEARQERAGYELNLLDGFWSPNRYYGFLNTFKYDNEKVVLDKYTIVEADRTWTVYNWLQHFSPHEIEMEFTESGFKVDAFYADVAGGAYDPGVAEFAVVASKP
jgi:2-polyprenyl-3-methyl-5-hydroxy-6-metoxy-1,4-benzoquinol methylase